MINAYCSAGCTESIGSVLLFLLLLPGLSLEGSADAVGEPHHGYFCISGLGNRTSHGVFAEEEAVRSQ